MWIHRWLFQTSSQDLSKKSNSKPNEPKIIYFNKCTFKDQISVLVEAWQVRRQNLIYEKISTSKLTSNILINPICLNIVEQAILNTVSLYIYIIIWTWCNVLSRHLLILLQFISWLYKIINRLIFLLIT